LPSAQQSGHRLGAGAHHQSKANRIASECGAARECGMLRGYKMEKCYSSLTRFLTLSTRSSNPFFPGRLERFRQICIRIGARASARFNIILPRPH
jgi:hypothetical protein